ncbi:MAG: uncharacterized protein KVP18_000697 [Porospora cf. gigantea A]|uniref:uncharacterized protein n=2 Tax=Porospora cf. gigantea A TaxID=2853593 RepID=UPI00355A3542|nr:MAG: hypothetical protein KVP18_000697 [Porospora cf. gigantea A]
MIAAKTLSSLPQRKTFEQVQEALKEKYLTHKVQRGDTLANLALRYNVKAERLKGVNPGIVGGDQVWMKEELIIPVHKDRHQEVVSPHPELPSDTRRERLSYLTRMSGVSRKMAELYLDQSCDVETALAQCEWTARMNQLHQLNPLICKAYIDINDGDLLAAEVQLYQERSLQ